ncbi:MAG: orotidine-5'-phosphate decarboxylase [Bacteroidota bacterium]|nr:orotidine-5'-phosphate decarboxylase [Bacteroidota bacterium]MDP4249769.1 orotidine-5'-phosphate decarboxylase [Bacteroidota bacterium]
MNRKQLVSQILQKRNYLCVGLDTDPARVPAFLKSFADPVFEFNKRIISATREFCIGYKINTAFYEAQGSRGWETLQKTVDCIPSAHFKIADAKRGDIGNTSAQYAKAFFETLQFDAVTVAPYMGEDSVRPFLEYKDKWTILLALTSNTGARDFELQPQGDRLLYENVLTKASQWGTTENLMFVVGATRGDWFSRIRALTPDHFYLVPGVGAQGGSLKEISEKGLNAHGGLLVNASRAIIYASPGEDFEEKAGKAASDYADEMSEYLKMAGL